MLSNGCVESQLSVAQFPSSVFQVVVDRFADAVSLEARKHAHACDFCGIWGGSTRSPHPDDFIGIVSYSNHELTSGFKIGVRDVTEIVILRAGLAVRIRLLEGKYMEIPHGLRIVWSVPSDRPPLLA